MLTDFFENKFKKKQEAKVSLSSFNPLSPNSDENEISLYSITSCSNLQVMRIKEVIFRQILLTSSIRNV